MTDETDDKATLLYEEARALLASLDVPLPEFALESIEANRALLLDHWSRLHDAPTKPA